MDCEEGQGLGWVGFRDRVRNLYLADQEEAVVRVWVSVSNSVSVMVRVRVRADRTSSPLKRMPNDPAIWMYALSGLRWYTRGCHLKDQPHPTSALTVTLMLIEAW